MIKNFIIKTKKSKKNETLLNKQLKKLIFTVGKLIRIIEFFLRLILFFT